VLFVLWQLELELVHSKKISMKRVDGESKLIPHWYPAHEVSCIVPLDEHEHAHGDSDDSDDEECAGPESTPGACVLTKPDRFSEFDRYRSAHTDGADPLRMDECAADSFKSIPGGQFVPRLCTLRPLLINQAAGSCEPASAAPGPDYTDGLALAIARGQSAAAAAEWSHLGRSGHLSVGSIVLSAQHGICEVIDESNADQEPPGHNWVRSCSAHHQHQRSDRLFAMLGRLCNRLQEAFIFFCLLCSMCVWTCSACCAR